MSLNDSLQYPLSICVYLHVQKCTYLTSSDPSDTESGGVLQLHTLRNHEAHVAVDSSIIGVRALVLEVTTVDGTGNLVADLERGFEVRSNLDNGTGIVTAVDDTRK